MSNFNQYACWQNHPLLNLDGLEIMGGSCTRLSSSDLKGYDIFIGFDQGMRFPVQANPAWLGGTSLESVLFTILDGGVPKSKELFDQLITYLLKARDTKQKVYMGCIGGHGRTGLVLAVLVKEILGEEDAITWVRKNYCQRAVETTAQVEWLNKHYTIKKVAQSKKHLRGGHDFSINPQFGALTNLTSYGGSASATSRKKDTRYPHTHYAHSITKGLIKV